MSKHYSASYDVDMARQYGLEAAVLYNKLVYLSRFTNREDGYCWRTAKELEEELGLSKYQQTRAIEILEKAGLIETKVTYITGTTSRAKHFKVTDSESQETSLSESKETSLSIESKETLLSESKETLLSINNNQKSNNQKKKIERKRHGEYNHVLLSEQEHSKLIEDFGEEIAARYIRKVDEYCEQSGRRYKNYYLAIRNTFMARDGVKPITKEEVEKWGLII